MNTIHNWINTGLIVFVLILGLVGGNTNQQPVLPLGGTTNFDSLELGETLLVTGAATLSSTATVSGTTTIGSIDLVVNTDLNKVGVGTSSPASIFHVANTPLGNGTNASTTLTFGSATSTSRAQFEMRQADGGVSCVYVNVAGTALVVQDGVCN